MIPVGCQMLQGPSGPRFAGKSIVQGLYTFDKVLADVEKEQQRRALIAENAAMLRQRAPDLCERVSANQITLDDALAMYQARREKHREVIKKARNVAETISSRFVEDVDAILAAVELGEKLTLLDEEMAAIRGAFKKLELHVSETVQRQ